MDSVTVGCDRCGAKIRIDIAARLSHTEPEELDGCPVCANLRRQLEASEKEVAKWKSSDNLELKEHCRTKERLEASKCSHRADAEKFAVDVLALERRILEREHERDEAVRVRDAARQTGWDEARKDAGVSIGLLKNEVNKAREERDKAKADVEKMIDGADLQVETIIRLRRERDEARADPGGAK